MKQALEFVADKILPPRCGSCGEIVNAHHSLCAACWATVNFIHDPMCVRCGHPFDFEIDKGLECGACQQEAPAFDSARSVFSYDETSREMVMRYKHGDALYLTPLFVKWLKPLVRDFAGENSIVVPVLLHWSRLFWRTYNQAALLATGLAKELTLDISLTDCVRRRRTRPQGKGAFDRVQNVKNAFSVLPNHPFQGKQVILVDDVYTSGATLEACASVLKKSGAQTVHCVTLARVLKNM